MNIKPHKLKLLSCAVLILVISPVIIAHNIDQPLIFSKVYNRENLSFIEEINNDNQKIPIKADLETPSPYKNVLVFVNPILYASSAIETAINTYLTDLMYSGYNPQLITTSYTDVVDLREDLQDYYYEDDIEGGVLIGQFPYAEFYDPTPDTGGVFICELFLMDLDGTWTDADEDGIYDNHTTTEHSDILPEIYMGRIDASRRTLGGKTEEEEILGLLDRIHAYYMGDPAVSRSHSGLLFIDDDWNISTFNWAHSIRKAYPNSTILSHPDTTTYAEDWMDHLSQDYEFAHVCVHSNPTSHYFYEPVENDIVLNSEIHAVPPASNFYILFSCSAADFATYDCLTTTYLFSGPRTLAVISSSKTGGILEPMNFYEPLRDDYSIGESFFQWFQGIESYIAEFRHWFYGMQIHGTPFVSIDVDSYVAPVNITSSTHPDPNHWYGSEINPNVAVQWTQPLDMNGITGYYYIIDQNPTTCPDNETGIYTTVNETTFTVEINSNSTYIHVVAVDGLGNIARDASHFRVNIDLDKPKIVSSSIENHDYCAASDIPFTWIVDDPHSGYANGSIWVDNSENLVYEGSASETLLTGLTEGDHTLNLTVEDKMGLVDSIQINFYVDLTNPTITIDNKKDEKLIIQDLEDRLEWTFSDSESGISLVEIYTNERLDTTIDGNEGGILFSELFSPEDEIKKIPLKIVGYDKSGRNSTDEVLLTLRKFSIPGYSMLYLEFASVLGIFFVLFLLKKKRRKAFQLTNQ